MEVAVTDTRTCSPRLVAAVVRQLGADRWRTSPLHGVMTGSPGGAAPGTSWLAAHLDEFSPLYLSYWLSLKVIHRQIQASLTDRR